MADSVSSQYNPKIHGQVALNPDGSTILGSSLPLPTGAATSANQTDGSQVTHVVDELPTTGNNPSLTISESVLGTVTTTTIQKTIGATTYQQTIAEDSSDNSVTISSWSEI